MELEGIHRGLRATGSVFKEKFSVLMEAPQSKLEEHSGKILLMKEMNNWEKGSW